MTSMKWAMSSLLMLRFVVVSPGRSGIDIELDSIEATGLDGLRLCDPALGRVLLALVAVVVNPNPIPEFSSNSCQIGQPRLCPVMSQSAISIPLMALMTAPW